MSHKIDDAYIEIVASAICHDLLSPIGAVASGLEFMEEEGNDPNGEALSLITASAAAASARLQLFRAAWGGMGASADFGPRQAFERMDSVLSLDARITQDWDPSALPPWEGKGAGKALLLALMMGRDCLPRGGVLRVRGQDGGLLIEASGERAVLRSHIESALCGITQPRDIPPDAVHAAITNLLLTRYGFVLGPRAFLEGRVALFLERAAPEAE